MKPRFLWVDVAKGILIAEVVLWHQANQFLKLEPGPGTAQAFRAPVRDEIEPLDHWTIRSRRPAAA